MKAVLIGWLVGLAVWAGLYWYGQHFYHLGYTDGKAAATAQYEQAAREAQDRQQAAANAASANYQQEKAVQDEKQSERMQTVTKIIREPVYINDCLDADGVRLINQAVGAR